MHKNEERYPKGISLFLIVAFMDFYVENYKQKYKQNI